MTTTSTGDTTVSAATLAGTAVTSWKDVTIAYVDATVIEGAGVRGTISTGAVFVATPTVVAAAQDEIEIPVPTLEATLLTGTVSPASITAPAAATDGVGATGKVGVGDVDAVAATIDGEEGIGSDIQAPVPTISATQATGRYGTGAIFVPIATVDGSHFTTNAAITGSIDTPVATVSATLTEKAVITGSVTGVVGDVQASSVSGNTASAEISVPVVTINTSGGASTIGTATVLIPAPVVEASGISTLSSPVFTGFMVNTRNTAVTELSGLTFNSMTNFAGLQLAATDTGVVALTSAITDEGTVISASAASGLSDFQSTSMKRIIAGYVSCRAAGVMTLTLITDEKTEREYRLVPRETGLHPAKVIFGQGVQGRNWQWKLANEGFDFDISELTLEVATLTRRRI